MNKKVKNLTNNMGAGASSIPDSLSEEDSKALLSSIGEDGTPCLAQKN